MSRLSFPALTSSSQIPGGWPGGGVIPVIPDFFPPPRLRPDSSSSRGGFSLFLNAFRAFLSLVFGRHGNLESSRPDSHASGFFKPTSSRSAFL